MLSTLAEGYPADVRIAAAIVVLVALNSCGGLIDDGEVTPLCAFSVHLAVVEQQFCVTHPWQRRTTGGVCTACASEQIAEGANA